MNEINLISVSKENQKKLERLGFRNKTFNELVSLWIDWNVDKLQEENR